VEQERSQLDEDIDDGLDKRGSKTLTHPAIDRILQA
jgi:hypothetical protein